MNYGLSLLIFSAISLLFGFIIFKVAKGSSMVRMVTAIFAVITSMVFHLSILFVWVLRDGLGPGAIESTGKVAILRFLQDAPMALVPTCILSFVLVMLIIKGRKKHK